MAMPNSKPVNANTIKKEIFEWYMTRFARKNEHQNNMCYNEIGLCAPTIDTILGPMVTQLGGYV